MEPFVSVLPNVRLWPRQEGLNMPQADLGTLPIVILPILLTNFSHPVARPLRHAKFLCRSQAGVLCVRFTPILITYALPLIRSCISYARPAARHAKFTMRRGAAHYASRSPGASQARIAQRNSRGSVMTPVNVPLTSWQKAGQVSSSATSKRWMAFVIDLVPQ